MENKSLLSICIPTYNRAKILEVTLKRIIGQINELDNRNLVSLFISDNASTDNTQEVVQRFARQEVHIEYHCNEKNLGPDGNFLKCFQSATGKYVWLLGDDDPVSEGAICYLLNILQQGDYGLVHLSTSPTNEIGYKIYHDVNEYLMKVSYWITFISANIFQSEIISKININEEMIHSYLMHVPFFLTSATSYTQNIVIDRKMLDVHLVDDNGGYNFFKVFVQNQFTLWERFVDRGDITRFCLDFVKEDTYKRFISFYIGELLILRRQLQKKKKKKGLKGGYDIENAWRILFRYYGKKSYFYIYLLKALKLSFVRAVKRIGRFIFI